jgi:hypothetical protein
MDFTMAIVGVLGYRSKEQKFDPRRVPFARGQHGTPAGDGSGESEYPVQRNGGYHVTQQLPRHANNRPHRPERGRSIEPGVRAGEAS